MFLPGVWHRHSQLPRKWSKLKFRSSPEVGDASSKSSSRHFLLPWCTPYVNVKLSGACAELKITCQLYGLSIRNPISKVRIAEPLYLKKMTVQWQKSVHNYVHAHSLGLLKLNVPCYANLLHLFLDKHEIKDDCKATARFRRNFSAWFNFV